MKVEKVKQSFWIVVMGVAFEHFDMMLVSLLASSVVVEFVGDTRPELKLLYAYIGYAIAFLFRPLGAFFFGCIGDLYGRKTALISSIILMTTATLALAFIPGVKVLGLATTIIFLLCRVAQGLAVGGEYGTAMTYAYELNPSWRTFYGACIISSTHFGGVLASFLAGIYIENFRMTFLIGGIIGLCLLLFRSLMEENSKQRSKKIFEITTESVKNKGAILQAALIASMQVLVFYGSLIYINELVHQELGIVKSQIFMANSFLLGLWIILPPYIAYIADKYFFSYLKIMRFGALGVFISAPFLGLSLVLAFYPGILISQMVVHVFHMIFCLCTPRFFGDLFGSSARNTAVSTSYSIGASFTAALAPMTCYISVNLFHTNFAICVPFMLMALVTIFILKKEMVYAKG
ncbi:Proline porter II [Candidatus Rubidus massiliensis]|nr:Proline porter II [Candidatus Rubidus massiliensis]